MWAIASDSGATSEGELMLTVADRMKDSVQAAAHEVVVDRKKEADAK